MFDILELIVNRREEISQLIRGYFSKGPPKYETKNKETPVAETSTTDEMSTVLTTSNPEKFPQGQFKLPSFH